MKYRDLNWIQNAFLFMIKAFIKIKRGPTNLPICLGMSIGFLKTRNYFECEIISEISVAFQFVRAVLGGP